MQVLSQAYGRRMSSLPAKKAQKTQPATTRRPKSVWHSLRKLENHLNKAHIQSGVFLNQLGALREQMSFEIRKEIVKKLVGSVHGDLLQALCERVEQLESGCHRNDVALNAILLGFYEVLFSELSIAPLHKEGEKFSIRAASLQDYDFDTSPDLSDETRMDKLTVEVLSCGWKVDGKMVIKPKISLDQICKNID